MSDPGPASEATGRRSPGKQPEFHRGTTGLWGRAWGGRLELISQVEETLAARGTGGGHHNRVTAMVTVGDMAF